MLLFILITLIANTILSHVIAKQGEDRKIGYSTAFLISFFFTPLIGILIVIASKEVNTQSQTETKPIKNDEIWFLGYKINNNESKNFPGGFILTIIITIFLLIILNNL
jgi:hypothetical protein